MKPFTPNFVMLYAAKLPTPAGRRGGDVDDVRDDAQFVFRCSQKVWECRLRYVEQAVLVDRDHPFPFVDVLIDDRSEEHESGVVDEDVEAAEVVYNLCYGLFSLGSVVMSAGTA